VEEASLLVQHWAYIQWKRRLC